MMPVSSSRYRSRPLALLAVIAVFMMLANAGSEAATAAGARRATRTAAAAPAPKRRFDGKVAIVTGGSRGIGRAISEALARDGATVVVNYSKSAAAAEETVAAIAAQGGKAIAIQADISKLEDVRRLYAEAQAQLGHIDIVVNNAGILPPAVPVKDETEQTFDAVFGLLKGTYFSMQEAAKRLPDGGRIINISSSTTRSWSPGYSIYAGSKSAIEQFTRSLSRELGPRQITVNGVVPGLTDTDMIDGYSAAVREGVAKSTTLGRLGQPRDIADVVAFLASDEGRWITGQMVVANGGSNP
jgi:3-oxoacyl-[acyl-carrier protein] reductase